MKDNISYFKSDITRLSHDGEKLVHAMQAQILGGKKFKELATKQFGKEKAEELIKKLPDFNTSYEAWYSESVALLKQILPDRVRNFIELYEKPKNRKAIAYGNYVVQDFLQGLRVNFGGDTKVDISAALPQMQQQVAIVSAAKVRFESSLFEIRQLIQADLFDDELLAARELHKNKFYLAAGAMAGVLLEKHLKEVCSSHSIAISKKNPTISDLNELLKSNSVIDVPQWRHISFLGDKRNICGHNKSSDPSGEQVKDLIDGTDKVLKTIH
ncbi:hypothetical protein [Methylorubrum extorquens]